MRLLDVLVVLLKICWRGFYIFSVCCVCLAKLLVLVLCCEMFLGFGVVFVLVFGGLCGGGFFSC